MTRRIFVLLPLAVALMAQPSPLAAQSPAHIKVVLVGDSTVAVQGGWGPGFCAHLIPAAECLDLAVNGRSTKSFIDEGLWAKALEAHGQFYFIQFGHNDQKDLPPFFLPVETRIPLGEGGLLHDIFRVDHVRDERCNVAEHLFFAAQKQR